MTTDAGETTVPRFSMTRVMYSGPDPDASTGSTAETTEREKSSQSALHPELAELAVRVEIPGGVERAREVSRGWRCAPAEGTITVAARTARLKDEKVRMLVPEGEPSPNSLVHLEPDFIVAATSSGRSGSAGTRRQGPLGTLHAA